MPPQVVDRLELDPGSGLLSESEANHFPRVKCVLIGDGAIGKTSLVVSYTTNGYPTEYVPTAFDNYTVVVTVDNRPIRLQLCDTAGQDDFDTLRPLCYPNTDIFLVCFSVVSPTSFHNLTEKWLPELREHSPKVPIILVGTQCDLRNDVKVLIELANYNERPIPEEEAQAKAREFGAVSYIECSALTQKNLKEVFDAAILATISGKEIFKKHGKKKSKKSKQKDDYKSTQKPPSDSKPRKGWKKFCCVA